MSFFTDWIERFLIRWRNWLRWLLEWLAGKKSGGGGTIPEDYCCYLARKDNECHWVGSKSNFTCPQGYYRQWWYCCEGTQQIACAECTQSQSTCWSGDWECSIWWSTGQSC
jgi:hypothetical protein